VENPLPDDFNDLNENLPTKSQLSVTINTPASALMSDVHPEN
jgi:hypothetical protein